MTATGDALPNEIIRLIMEAVELQHGLLAALKTAHRAATASKMLHRIMIKILYEISAKMVETEDVYLVDPPLRQQQSGRPELYGTKGRITFLWASEQRQSDGPERHITSPLLWASERGCKATMALTLEHTPHLVNFYAVSLALYHGHLHVARTLIDHLGEKAKKIDETVIARSTHPLIIAISVAIHHSYLDVARTLIDISEKRLRE